MFIENKALQLNEKTFNAVQYLRFMLLVREGDRREGILMRQGKGWIHIPAMGHESLGTLALHLHTDDYIFPYYRDRALMLARGLTPYQLACDYFACAKSSSGGRNMPVHCSAKHLNIFPPATPTGVQCLPAVGAAWGIKKADQPNIVLCTIGDAASRQGEFFEAVCFAVQEKLPIIFLVEDNAYGISTPTNNMLPFRLGIFNENLVIKVNGRDIFEVFEIGRQVIGKARAGDGPTILWCDLDRLTNHTNSDDHRIYRSAAEIEEMAQRDPIKLLSKHLIASGELTEFELNKMQAEVTEEIDAVYRQAEEEPLPDPAKIMHHLYSSPVEYCSLDFQPQEEKYTIVAAMNQVFEAALQKYSNMLMFGQDIEDPKGGVFGFTKGLSSRFPDRVINSPLAEATILGTAVGLAATGYKPVFEIQFIDFLTPGFHQLVNQIATLRWRSQGDWACPMVLYAPYGAYLPAGGMWHSQSNDGWWAHTPGIRIAIPSTPEDTVGLFWAALQDEDPSLILIPKHIFRVRKSIGEYKPISFGTAVVRRSGNDVTVVSWGNCLELAEQAAAQLELEGISIEIIDLRTLVPCDWQTIENSIAKTGRLVVIHEDNRTCGFGQAVITEMTSVPKRFNYFLSPPQLVARDDIHIPFSPILEYAVLPSIEQVLQAIHKTLE